MVRWKKLFTHILVFSAVVAVCCFIRYGVKAVVISGSSMLPTLTNGMVVRYTLPEDDIRRGQIVLIKEHGDGNVIVKRIMGLPGEMVSINNEMFCVNGEAILDYNFGPIKNAGILSESATLLLKEGEYFCLGDNYEESRDSRMFGPVKSKWIVGIVKEQ